MAEYIERDAIKAAVRKRLTNSLIIGWLIRIINEIPAADVAPVVRGEWVDKEDYYIEVGMTCSVCGVRIFHSEDMIIFNYCPNCGAHMKDGDNSD